MADHGLDQKITLPSLRFNRQIGIHGGKPHDYDGNPISAEDWQRRRTEWLPSEEDYAYVKSCMVKVHDKGKFANWIAPPAQGINDQPVDFEYVQFH